MGSVFKKAKKTARGVVKGIGEVFEEVVEKPAKKAAEEISDLPQDIMTMAGLAEQSVVTPEVTPEITPEEVPDDSSLMGSKLKRTRFKKAGPGGTLIEGYGSLYKTPEKKAVGG